MLDDVKDVRVFLCYDCELDTGPAEVVRKILEEKGKVVVGYWDKKELEEAKRSGDKGYVDLVHQRVKHTDVTIVLISDVTSKCRWVELGIRKTHVRGHGLLGVVVDKIREAHRFPGHEVENPFDRINIFEHGHKAKLSETTPVYDWKEENGIEQICEWVTKAAVEIEDDIFI